jgi:tetratricopeptide (TPR) repeat protein
VARGWWLTVALAGALVAQQTQAPPPTQSTTLKTRDEKPAKSDAAAAAPADGKYAVPAEEDDELKPKTDYAFNPVQAKKELRVGEFYWKKGNYRAAMGRFEEATKWNPGFGEAYVRLAEAAEKVNDKVTEKQAYQKYLDANPDAKNAKEIKKKLSELK